jgi:hypothetical protein
MDYAAPAFIITCPLNTKPDYTHTRLYDANKGGGRGEVRGARVPSTGEFRGRTCGCFTMSLFGDMVLLPRENPFARAVEKDSTDNIIQAYLVITHRTRLAIMSMAAVRALEPCRCRRILPAHYRTSGYADNRFGAHGTSSVVVVNH